MDQDNQIQAFVMNILGFLPEGSRGMAAGLLMGILIGYILLQRFINPILVFVNNIGPFLDKIRGKQTDEATENLSLRPDIQVLRDVWLKDRHPDSVLEIGNAFTRTRVLSVLNMKGGVGKTTLSANLGAAIHNRGKRVLFVDYDYQGSLSLMVAGSFHGSRRDVGVNSYKTLYPMKADDVASAIVALPGKLEGCGILGASYHLFRDEMEQFAKWSANTLRYDVRTQFRNFVKSDFVQSNYDVIIIDCGPRFTTSTINALCGSTHFLVPTILDELSSQAVSFLDNEISAHRDELFPQLRLLGVIPTFVYQDPNPTPKFIVREKEQIDTIDRSFAGYCDGSPFLAQARIPRRNGFAKNADRIVYYESSDAKRIFNRAAAEVLKGMAK